MKVSITSNLFLFFWTKELLKFFLILKSWSSLWTFFLDYFWKLISTNRTVIFELIVLKKFFDLIKTFSLFTLDMSPSGTSLSITTYPFTSFNIGCLWREDLFTENTDPISLYRKITILTIIIGHFGVIYTYFVGTWLGEIFDWTYFNGHYKFYI